MILKALGDHVGAEGEFGGVEVGLEKKGLDIETYYEVWSLGGECVHLQTLS